MCSSTQLETCPLTLPLTQVVVTLAQWQDSSEYQQQNVTLDRSVSSERKPLLFTGLRMGAEYRRVPACLQDTWDVRQGGGGGGADSSRGQ